MVMVCWLTENVRASRLTVSGYWKCVAGVGYGAGGRRGDEGGSGGKS